jgi:ribosomal protein S18 acetylase RimI-like enzyme
LRASRWRCCTFEYDGGLVRPRPHAIELLDNIVWNSLAGPHLRFSEGNARARRFARGFPAFAGFADLERPDLESLVPLCEAGEMLLCAQWTGPVPRGWHVGFEGLAIQYVWEGRAPEADPASEALPLGAAHAERMVALADLTKPGPFGPRSVELGEYYGLFEGERLIAMAGERLGAGRLREVSAVCTHPGFQGRGLARRLMEKVIRIQLARGDMPFLHVMAENARARSLYEHMGFRQRREVALRAVKLERS